MLWTIARLSAHVIVLLSFCQALSCSNPSRHRKHSADGCCRRQFLSHTPPLLTIPTILRFPTSPAEAAAPTTDDNDPFGNEEILLPFSTQRRYKKITLAENSLPVLLVSDKTVQCQAALTIEAGQFCDTLPGIAHLMEHMILSYEEPRYDSRTSLQKKATTQDFEEWLGDRADGYSNAFTANQKVCFHFTCPRETAFADALKRFSHLFLAHNVFNVCRNPVLVKREIRRVDSELDWDSYYNQEEHLTKAFVNVEHPYSVFSKGSVESLETTPKKKGIDVGEELVKFFQRFYRPQNATLVLLGPQSLDFLERCAEQCFNTVLSTSSSLPGPSDYFPGRFLQLSAGRYKHVILYQPNSNSKEIPDKTEKLSFHWVLDLDYRNRDRTKLITVSQVAFVICQILGRRGPGSLYQYLLRREWIVEGAIPKISVPVDVSGFQVRHVRAGKTLAFRLLTLDHWHRQVMKLELALTQEGFVNRSRVITAVYDSIETLRPGDSFVIRREIMAQYSSIAKLFGYSLAPRPPDAIELSFDGLVYGIDAVGENQWYRFPEDRNGLGLNPIRRAVKNTLVHICNQESAVIIVSANESSLNRIGSSFDSLKWRREPVSGGAFRFDGRFGQDNLLVSKLVNKDELFAPVYNGLVPSHSVFPVLPGSINNESVFGVSRIAPGWSVWTLGGLQGGIVLPKQPPEQSCGRSAFTVQFLTPQPARASVRQAAYGELWKLCLENDLTELAELGAPGGLAYEVSYNRFGLRFSFLGVSATLASYVRRVIRRVAAFQSERLTIEQSTRSLAVKSSRMMRGLSPIRRRVIVSNLRAASSEQVFEEGQRLFGSITGVISFSQGAISRQDSERLTEEVRFILEKTLPDTEDPQQKSATPKLGDLVYKPTWKPRFASGCFVPGVVFMADACGRVKR